MEGAPQRRSSVSKEREEGSESKLIPHGRKNRYFGGRLIVYKGIRDWIVLWKFIVVYFKVFLALCVSGKKMSDDRNDLDFDAVILVTRGDELPKKNYEKKKHPTYEVRKCMLNMRENKLFLNMTFFRHLFESSTVAKPRSRSRIW